MSNIKSYFTIKTNAKSSMSEKMSSTTKIITDENKSPPTKIRKDNTEIFELCSTSSTHQEQVSR
jgi:hypothetical protein